MSQQPPDPTGWLADLMKAQHTVLWPTGDISDTSKALRRSSGTFLHSDAAAARRAARLGVLAGRKWLCRRLEGAATDGSVHGKGMVMTKQWRQNAGLLALRAGVGGVLVAHGVQKLFGWLGGHGLEGTGAAFEQMGFVPGRQSALAAGLGEAGGGLLIALGLATPVAGAAAVGTMIPAATVHAPRGFFATGGGYEYPALLGVSAAALTLTGPGDWSLDALLDHRLNQAWLAALALLTSSAASLAIVQRRRGELAARTASSERQAAKDTDAAPDAAVGSDARPANSQD